MSKLTVLDWDKPNREVHFVGYNRDHTAGFIRDEQNAQRAITLLLPKLFHLRFHENPIGKDGSPPVEISRAALHLPACFATKKEKEAFDDRHSMEAQCALTMQVGVWGVERAAHHFQRNARHSQPDTTAPCAAALLGKTFLPCHTGPPALRAF